MKKILLGAGVILFAIGAGSSFAQNKTTATTTQNAAHSRVEAKKAAIRNMPPERIAAIKTARLDKAIGLSEQQKVAVKSIYLNEAKQNKDRIAGHQATQKKIESVLNKDQALKLQELKKERMDKMRSQRTERATNSNG